MFGDMVILEEGESESSERSERGEERIRTLGGGSVSSRAKRESSVFRAKPAFSRGRKGRPTSPRTSYDDQKTISRRVTSSGASEPQRGTDVEARSCRKTHGLSTTWAISPAEREESRRAVDALSCLRVSYDARQQRPANDYGDRDCFDVGRRRRHCQRSGVVHGRTSRASRGLENACALCVVRCALQVLADDRCSSARVDTR